MRSALVLTFAPFAVPSTLLPVVSLFCELSDCWVCTSFARAGRDGVAKRLIVSVAPIAIAVSFAALFSAREVQAGLLLLFTKSPSLECKSHQKIKNTFNLNTNAIFGT